MLLSSGQVTGWTPGCCPPTLHQVTKCSLDPPKGPFQETRHLLPLPAVGGRDLLGRPEALGWLLFSASWAGTPSQNY